jgi:hypothetical protein
LSPAPSKRWRRWITAAWALLFALAYSQDPLYSSNQNQYFLHGLAQAGVGFLRQDWLAKTADPTPLFTMLVRLTADWLPQATFYLYDLLLLALAFVSLLALADRIFRIRSNWLGLTLFSAGLILLCSAGVRFILEHGLGLDWGYLFDGGLAGQRLMGPVLQPSSFGVLLLGALILFLDDRWVLSGLLIALTASIHPTYLLTGGLLVIGMAAAWLLEGGNWQRPAAFAGLIGMLVLPVFLYTYRLFAASSAAVAAQSREILVNARIPHHTLIASWLGWPSAVQLGLMVIGLALLRRTRLGVALLVASGLALALTVAQAVTGSDSLALLFPWRLSTVVVPVSTAMLLAWGAMRFSSWLQGPAGSLGLLAKALPPLAWLAIVLAGFGGMLRFQLATVASGDQPSDGLYAYVRAHRASGEVFMVPPDMQDFRLATGMPAYVDFKSIPYKPEDVIEWAQRIHVAGLVYRDRPDEVSCKRIGEAQRQGGVTHVVLSQAQFGADCGPWEQVYKDAWYAVYALAGH